MTETSAADAPVTHTVQGFCSWAGVSRQTAQRAMNSGALPFRKAGRRVLILKSDAQHWLDALPRN